MALISYVVELYEQQGLRAEHVVDHPNHVYEPHQHEKTYLYTVAGSLTIKLEGTTHVLEVGKQFVVESDQLHSATVGPEGCEYIAAWDPEEAMAFAAH
jgi:quercetin dioxygenase-like cupin family protein